MKDDHVQGILFSKSHTVRFRQVSMPPQGLLGKARQQTRSRVMRPLATTVSRNRVAKTDTPLGNYIDYAITEEQLRP